VYKFVFPEIITYCEVGLEALCKEGCLLTNFGGDRCRVIQQW